MSWFSRKQKQQRPSGSTRRRSSLKRFECLENRNLMASGLVNVLLTPFAPPGTALALVGDGSNNEVDINQTLNVGEYTIQGRNGTLLQLNGSFATTPSMTVNGVNGSITVELGSGNDVLRILARPDSQQSSLPGNLAIVNGDGSDINTLDKVLVNGGLSVTKASGTSGYSELNITSSMIVGSTVVSNDGGQGGDTKTVIDNSWLQGAASGPAFTLTNGTGADINNIRGNSQFGLGPFAAVNPVVSINNGDGGSQTTFTGASAVAGMSTTTIYGRLTIVNGTNLPGFIELVTFQATNVLGPVDLSNGDGNNTTEVLASTLGSHLVLGSDNRPVIGGPLSVANDSGYDELRINGSALPWGLVVNNNAANAAANWGSASQISQSSIGTGPYGPRIFNGPMIAAGVAALIRGDNGRDLFNVEATSIGGRLDMGLTGGNNVLNITNNSLVVGLLYVGNSGNDQLTIDRSKIVVDVELSFGDGADEFYLRNMVLATDWPSPLLGKVVIDGGLGVDRTNLSSLIPNNFELIVP